MKFLKDAFSERGDVSMIRIMSLISLLTGCYLAIVGKDTSVLIFVTAGFTGKILQKRSEK